MKDHLAIVLKRFVWVWFQMKFVSCVFRKLIYPTHKGNKPGLHGHYISQSHQFVICGDNLFNIFTSSIPTRRILLKATSQIEESLPLLDLKKWLSSTPVNGLTALKTRLVNIGLLQDNPWKVKVYKVRKPRVVSTLTWEWAHRACWYKRRTPLTCSTRPS